MTPEKEQQIASRILERAELAQMTRQLRLNLSRAGEKRRAAPANTEKIRRVSPKKTSHSIPQRSAHTPPPPPPSRDVRDPSTPSASRQDDGGADLLMYLATSPCASAKRAPSTPNGNALSPGEPIRYSHLKHNASSSPFKMNESPMLYMVRGGHPSTPGRNDIRFNMGDYVHDLFSPSPGFSSGSSSSRAGIHATPLALEKTNRAAAPLSNSSPGGHLRPGSKARRKVGDDLGENGGGGGRTTLAAEGKALEGK